MFSSVILGLVTIVVVSIVGFSVVVEDTVVDDGFVTFDTHCVVDCIGIVVERMDIVVDCVEGTVIPSVVFVVLDVKFGVGVEVGIGTGVGGGIGIRVEGKFEVESGIVTFVVVTLDSVVTFVFSVKIGAWSVCEVVVFSVEKFFEVVVDRDVVDIVVDTVLELAVVETVVLFLCTF